MTFSRTDKRSFNCRLLSRCLFLVQERGEQGLKPEYYRARSGTTEVEPSPGTPRGSPGDP